jgi:hypothetical protein
MKLNILSSTISMVLLSLVIGGCSSAQLGPDFTNIKKPSSNKAIVYVVMTDNVWLNEGVNFEFYTQDKAKNLHFIGMSINNSYYYKEFEPGDFIFKSNSKMDQEVKASLQAGKIYCLDVLPAPYEFYTNVANLYEGKTKCLKLLKGTQLSILNKDFVSENDINYKNFLSQCKKDEDECKKEYISTKEKEMH